MKKIFDKNKFTILAWLLLLIYVFFAHDLYVILFLSEAEGQPIIYHKKIPPSAEELTSDFEKLSDLGNGLYSLSGWAFFQPNPDNIQFQKFIILQSDKRTYLYSVYSSSEKILFFMSKDFIEPGSYRVGVLFQDKEKLTTIYYGITNKIIVRTPNYLKLESDKSN